MCLSLRLRCLLLLNGGRQGDCVRVEFWLRETLLQRLLSLPMPPPNACFVSLSVHPESCASVDANDVSTDL